MLPLNMKKIFTNVLKTALFDHYALVEITNFALEITFFEIPLIQVEEFLNLK